jgi:ATP-dependent protease Clp ATPase subunit
MAIFCEDCASSLQDCAAEWVLEDAVAAILPGDIQAFQQIPKPKEIKTYLDEYIIGQDEAKRYLRGVGVQPIISACNSPKTRMVWR